MNRRFSFSSKILVAALAMAVVGALALPVVAGTPGEAVKLDAAEQVLALNQLAGRIIILNDDKAA